MNCCRYHLIVDSSPSGKRVLRPPAEFGTDLRGVDRIAAIMARPVGDESNKRSPRPPRRRDAVQNIADQLDDIEVGAFAVAAEIVFLAGAALA